MRGASISAPRSIPACSLDKAEPALRRGHGPSAVYVDRAYEELPLLVRPEVLTDCAPRHEGAKLEITRRGHSRPAVLWDPGPISNVTDCPSCSRSNWPIARGLMKEVFVAVRSHHKAKTLVGHQTLDRACNCCHCELRCELVSVASMCLIAKCDETTFPESPAYSVHTGRGVQTETVGGFSDGPRKGR